MPQPVFWSEYSSPTAYFLPLSSVHCTTVDSGVDKAGVGPGPGVDDAGVGPGVNDARAGPGVNDAGAGTGVNVNVDDAGAGPGVGAWFNSSSAVGLDFVD